MALSLLPQGENPSEKNPYDKWCTESDIVARFRNEEYAKTYAINPGAFLEALRSDYDIEETGVDAERQGLMQVMIKVVCKCQQFFPVRGNIDAARAVADSDPDVTQFHARSVGLPDSRKEMFLRTLVKLQCATGTNITKIRCKVNIDRVQYVH